MADVEDETDFGSHFLDSMLEVEMTEEDDELDVSRNEDPLETKDRTLPPIPTFDLQSETLSYKNVYRNTLVQPVLAAIPLATETPPEAVPLAVPALKPSPLLMYSKELVPNKTSTPTVKLNSNPASKVSPKSNAKSPAKNTVKNLSDSWDAQAAQFIKEVFKSEYIKNVFVKADPPHDISEFGEAEMEYYNACFKDVSRVQYCRLHCTICDKHLGCSVKGEKKINVHTMLKVLTCKPCFEFYGDGNFPCDKGDNCEIYCRWCGQGGALVCCSFCPRVFCKKCVKRNYGPAFLRSIQRASDWACFCCAQKPLWPHRAICRALVEYIAQKKTDPKTSQRDTTKCCKRTPLTRKKVKAGEKTPAAAVTPPSGLRLNPVTKGFNFQNKIILTGKAEQSILKTNLQANQYKPSVTSVKISKRGSKPNATFSPKSILTGNNILRGLATNSPKMYPNFPPPQLFKSPVLHGETLITPPSRYLVRPKTPPNPTPLNSFVKVSLTNQPPNLDISKIPTAKIPHNVQGLILRLSLPDNKVQLVRLTTDGDVSKSFPMPEFKSGDLTFIEENLAESFRVSKTIYDKLMIIRNKVNSRTKFTEENVYKSAVDKLHFVYKKSIELFKELDDTLTETYEEWKGKPQNAVDVIDLSDDEGKETHAKAKRSRYSTFREKCKELSDDSEVEILDDAKDASGSRNSSKKVNGVPVNFKEKYRSRGTSIDRSKLVETRKRKRAGRPRKNKRLRDLQGKPAEEGKSSGGVGVRSPKKAQQALNNSQKEEQEEEEI